MRPKLYSLALDMNPPIKEDLQKLSPTPREVITGTIRRFRGTPSSILYHSLLEYSHASTVPPPLFVYLTAPAVTTEKREHARKVHMMGRRREDVRDSFLDLVDNEKETAIQALETPLEVSTLKITPRVDFAPSLYDFTSPVERW